MSTQELQPGDEVVLRTGGPVMTVLGSEDDQPLELFCVWFDERREAEVPRDLPFGVA